MTRGSLRGRLDQMLVLEIASEGLAFGRFRLAMGFFLRSHRSRVQRAADAALMDPGSRPGLTEEGLQKAM